MSSTANNSATSQVTEAQQTSRISSIRDAFRRVEPGETPPEAPESLRIWCSQTTYGLLGGMLFGGYRGLLQARNKSIPSPVPTNSIQHRTAVFFVRESILTGSRIGVFVSVFSATALAIGNSGFTAGVDHPTNYAAAGALTCGLFAAAVGGWAPAAPAAVFGAGTAGAAAMANQSLQHAVASSLVSIDVPQVRDEDGSVARVIHTFEQNLAKHPLRTMNRSSSMESAE
ncbi:hypothetical protein BWQ96_00326 [Gracilariopsis chorda]|uniref:Uncharacterized protein n=1 Tax=Gracilariopsis chorda TaxID=448386 RepID=A0A2V3J6W1_9FLOR|nr:hypothetical protein BWQ96_00326 [Gracilariopsis chorda]|eukprot:PXF50166.1 hypothetical protein BWQ96_00326 [Gracilariopsis chorda]